VSTHKEWIKTFADAWNDELSNLEKSTPGVSKKDNEFRIELRPIREKYSL